MTPVPLGTKGNGGLLRPLFWKETQDKNGPLSNARSPFCTKAEQQRRRQRRSGLLLGELIDQKLIDLVAFQDKLFLDHFRRKTIRCTKIQTEKLLV